MAEHMYTGDAGSGTLPHEVSSEIWADTQEASAVMRFANRINLPGPGLTIPMVTADPSASWVGETAKISRDDSTLSSKSMKASKVGVIETFSKEFKRDLPAMYAELRRRLPNAIARKFDATVFHQASGTPIGTEFNSFAQTGSAVQALSLGESEDGVYSELVSIDQAVAMANGNLSGYVLSPKARGVLLRAVDANDRPLLLNDIQRQGSVDQLLGVDVARVGAAYAAGVEDTTAETLGFAGDWSKAYYGVVQDIEVSVSDQATVDGVNLFEQDMFAVKVTAHLGFILRDPKFFVRITGATPNDVA